MNIYCYLIFIPIIYISSIIILFSNSWFSQWIIIEINLIRFLRIVVFDKKNSVSINYFLIQVFNSYVFIIIVINLNFINSYSLFIILFLLNLSLLTKIGIPPFFIWYINLIKQLNWLNCFLLMTIQKFIPLMILNNLFIFNNLIVIKFNIINIIYITIICSFLGLQSINLKILLSYSSIIQILWIIILIYVREVIFISYLFIYYFIMIIIFIVINKFNLVYLTDLYLIKLNNKILFLIYLIVFISLARIPPFLGFLTKWIAIQSLRRIISLIYILLIIFSSLISIFFYLRVMFLRFINYSISIKLNFLIINNYINSNNYSLIYFIWITFTLLILYEFI